MIAFVIHNSSRARKCLTVGQQGGMCNVPASVFAHNHDFLVSLTLVVLRKSLRNVYDCAMPKIGIPKQRVLLSGPNSIEKVQGWWDHQARRLQEMFGFLTLAHLSSGSIYASASSCS